MTTDNESMCDQIDQQTAAKEADRIVQHIQELVARTFSERADEISGAAEHTKANRIGDCATALPRRQNAKRTADSTWHAIKTPEGLIAL